MELHKNNNVLDCNIMVCEYLPRHELNIGMAETNNGSKIINLHEYRTRTLGVFRNIL